MEIRGAVALGTGGGGYFGRGVAKHLLDRGAKVRKSSYQIVEDAAAMFHNAGK